MCIAVWYYSKHHTALNSSDSILSRLQRVRSSSSHSEEGILHLRGDSLESQQLFSWYGKDVCITEGHNQSLSQEGKCICKSQWAGKRCGLPRSLLKATWMSDINLVKALQVRRKPKQIVVVINDFILDFDLLELNVRVIADIVDVFIISENCNIYAAQNQSLLSKIQNGFLQTYHDKFVYVNLNDSMCESFIDCLHYTTDKGLKLISGMRPDDLLLFSSSEVLFNREFILFLKVFHNYPLPIQCHRSTKFLYDFSWKLPDNIYYKSSKPSSVTTSKINNREKRTESDSKEFSNRRFVQLYPFIKEKSGDDDLYFCAISIHLFTNVFENKVNRLNDIELLYKEKHQTFFDSLRQPVFPWKYHGSHTSCHFCQHNDGIYFKVLRLRSASLLGVTADDKEKIMERIKILRHEGKDEFKNKAMPVYIDNGTKVSNMPEHIYKTREEFPRLFPTKADS